MYYTILEILLVLILLCVQGFTGIKEVGLLLACYIQFRDYFLVLLKLLFTGLNTTHNAPEKTDRSTFVVTSEEVHRKTTQVNGIVTEIEEDIIKTKAELAS